MASNINATFYVRCRDWLIPVTVKTNSNDRKWLAYCQTVANDRVNNAIRTDECARELSNTGIRFVLFK